jgi:hypothetical protein
VTRRPAGPAARWLALLVALLCLAAPAAAPAAAPQPQVVGNRLVDAATGTAFVPRGVNWPSFEYACQQGWGYSATSDPVTSGPDPANAALIASWNINTVRLPLNQDCWLGDDAMPAFGTVDGYRAAVQAWVSALHAAGLAVILDLHWSGPDGSVADGQRAMTDDRSDDFWTSVATTFRDDRSVIFDVFNEPYSRFDGAVLSFDLTWDCWRNGGCAVPRPTQDQPLDGTTYTAVGMQQLVDAVRVTGAQQPVMVAGIDYANDMSQWLANRPTDGQLVASWHNYDSQACSTQACWDATIAPIAAQLPVVAGEFGQTDCGDDHLTSFMNWADARGVGYLIWAWWVLPDPSCSVLAVLADVSGTPRAPNGTALKAHLAALAAAPPAAPPAGVAAGGGDTATVARPTLTSDASRDTRAPSTRLAARARQRLGRAVAVRVTCDERCTARASGTLVVTARGSRRATFRLRPASGTGLVGRAKTLRPRLSRAARRAAVRALRRRGRVTARISVRVTDALGNARTATGTVRLTLR